MSDNFKFVQAQNFSLSGAGASAGATSITLKSFAGIDGDLLTMTDFGLIGYGTLEPENGTQEEQISFTGVTQNSNGTATLTGVSTVLFISPYTESSGLAKTHAGSTTFVISNTSAFYDKLTSKDDDETIDGLWTFTQSPIVPDPIGLTDAANKEWVLSVVNGGDITTNALIENGTAGELVSAGQVVYLKVADGRWWKANGSTAATVNNVQLGIAQGTGTAGNSISGGVLRKGLDSNQSGGSAGSLGYIQNGGGTVGTSTGTIERVVGQFASATTFTFDPDFYYELTALQKAALVGASGTAPSGSNKFVDVALAASTATAGIAEEATLAEVNNGTAAGGQGRLFQNPSTPTSYGVAGPSTVAKTYFSMQLPFILWTGATANDATTSFVNWVRSGSDVNVAAGGAGVDFQGTGADSISNADGVHASFWTGASTPIQWSGSGVVIFDGFAKLPSSPTGDIQFGFEVEDGDINVAYNNQGATGRATFALNGTTLYATIAKQGVGVTNTDISSGLTLTSWNHYRIELTLGTSAKFYVNGSLKATLSGANLYTGTGALNIGYGRSNTALFQVTAPNFSVQLI